MQLVLSLFPGADLLGRAFEAEGFCVVRGPDLLWGQDVRDYHVPAGRFDGIIGGPPCQLFSQAQHTGTRAVNLVGEFTRLVDEAQPNWAVMENVNRAQEVAPDWPSVMFSDADVGGLTKRVRRFWFYGIPAAKKPVPNREARAKAAYAVLASSYRQGNKDTYPFYSPADACRLQGFSGLEQALIDSAPHELKRGRGMRALIVHLVGNGVPLAMGRYIARHVKAQTEGNPAESWQMTGLPLFATRPAAADGGEE